MALRVGGLGSKGPRPDHVPALRQPRRHAATQDSHVPEPLPLERGTSLVQLALGLAVAHEQDRLVPQERLAAQWRGRQVQRPVQVRGFMLGGRAHVHRQCATAPQHRLCFVHRHRAGEIGFDRVRASPGSSNQVRRVRACTRLGPRDPLQCIGKLVARCSPCGCCEHAVHGCEQ